MTRRAAVAALAAAVSAKPQDTLFHSAVSLVRVDAAVTDANGRILTNLTQQDFHVFDDGKEQPIVHFSFEEEPLDVILLFDTGGNMHSKILQLLRAVELGFHELKKGDRAGVMIYSGVAVQLLPLTADFGAVNDTILLSVIKQHFGGASKLLPAAADAAHLLEAAPATQRRRAILIVTDKTASRTSAGDSTVRDLWQANAVLSELILDHPPQPVDAAVANSGGATIAAGADPGAAFQDSLRRLRRRYTLYYAMPPGPPGTARSIRLESPPGTRTFARTGYFVV